jgi:hypothetical protein
MLKAVRTSETSVNFNVTTQRYIPEDSKTSYSSLRESQISKFSYRLGKLSRDLFKEMRRPERETDNSVVPTVEYMRRSFHAPYILV